MKKNQLIPMLLFLTVLFCALGTGKSSIASIRIESSKLNAQLNITDRDTNRAYILSVLEEKVESREAAERLKKKVSTLSDKQTRLIASLARLTTDGNQAAGAEIVFFVMMVLIIVS